MGFVTEDTRLDLWLEKHPRLDHAYTNVYISTVGRVRRAKQYFPDYLARRKFKPGTFFLDHGVTPAVVSSIDRDGHITGVSLVDGRFVGSDIWSCGPEVTDLEGARAQADEIQAAKLQA